MPERFEITASSGVTYWLEQRPDQPGIWHRAWYQPAERDASTGQQRAGTRTRRRASLRTDDIELAKLRLAQWIIENDRPAEKAPDDVLIEELLVAYWLDHAQYLGQDVKTGTIPEERLTSRAKTQRSNTRKWSTYWAGQPLSAITLTEVRAFTAWLVVEQGCSKSYARRILGAGRAAFNHAHKHGLITAVPHIDMPAAPETESRILTGSEVRALFEACETAHGFMYLLLAFTTLAREEALLDLQWFQVDPRNRLIKLNPPGREQTKKRRPVVPITDVALPYLERRGEGHVIKYRGGPVSSVKTMLKQTGKRAGVGPIGSRVIRHTMATQLRKAGAPMWDVEGQLGHKLPSTSENYAVYDPDYLSTTTRAIDDFMRSNVGHLLEEKRELVLSGRSWFTGRGGRKAKG